METIQIFEIRRVFSFFRNFGFNLKICKDHYGVFKKTDNSPHKTATTLKLVCRDDDDFIFLLSLIINILIL